MTPEESKSELWMGPRGPGPTQDGGILEAGLREDAPPHQCPRRPARPLPLHFRGCRWRQKGRRLLPSREAGAATRAQALKTREDTCPWC